MEDFPPNSKRSQEGAREAPKRVEQVTSGEVVRRKKPLGKQFKSTFFGGDGRTAADYVIFHVLIPAVKDMIVEAGQTAIERIIHGESRSMRRRGMGGPPSGASGHIDYRGMSNRDDRPPMPRGGPSRRARARHDFDDIVLSSRSEAEEVIDRLFDLINRYEAATVADLYELTGIQASHTDNKWGWTDMRGSTVARVRNGGYLLNLPDPEPLE